MTGDDPFRSGLAIARLLGEPRTAAANEATSFADLCERLDGRHSHLQPCGFAGELKRYLTYGFEFAAICRALAYLIPVLAT
jgi:hypothetical protein